MGCKVREKEKRKKKTQIRQQYKIEKRKIVAKNKACALGKKIYSVK